MSIYGCNIINILGLGGVEGSATAEDIITSTYAHASMEPPC